MKKSGNILYIVICLVVCVLPFAGMTVYRTDTTTENKTLAAFPDLVTDGEWNLEFFDGLSDYFEDHFAFRRELVSADAQIQSKIFHVSNVDTVVAGTDGWLYYTDTLNDYLGRDTMNDRQVFNTVHNLTLLQSYVEARGIRFVFTVAPNKNSLYGEHMPYYDSCRTGERKNIELLTEPMQEAEISYADLFTPFERRSQTLYLKRDSHWNNEGAVLAYNTILDAVEYEHDTFETVAATRRLDEYGDLNRMLYPLTGEPEWNIYYEDVAKWEYTGADADVEAAYLETACEDKTGSLLMFRDSFGNTLVPLMAQQFATAVFSKSVPYRIAEYIDACDPTLVIAEKVERNLDEYMTTPPILPGSECETKEAEQTSAYRTNICADESADDTSYYLISGVIEGEETPATDAGIYIQIGSGEDAITYEAFTTSTEDSDYGYQLYLSKKTMQEKGILDIRDADISVLVEQDGTCMQVQDKE